MLHMLSIRKMLNMCVFVDTDDDVRLARRIQRDVSVRGRDVDGKLSMCAIYMSHSACVFLQARVAPE